MGFGGAGDWQGNFFWKIIWEVSPLSLRWLDEPYEPKRRVSKQHLRRTLSAALLQKFSHLCIKHLPLWQQVDFLTKTFPRALTDFISHRKVHKFIPHSLCINIFPFFPIQAANYQQITIANQLSQPFAWFYNKHSRDLSAYSELCWVQWGKVGAFGKQTRLLPKFICEHSE